MRVVVDPEACDGCGPCVEVCPQVFEVLEGENVARVKLDPVPPDAEEACRTAADNCPTEAITIEA